MNNTKRKNTPRNPNGPGPIRVGSPIPPDGYQYSIEFDGYIIPVVPHPEHVYTMTSEGLGAALDCGQSASLNAQSFGHFHFSSGEIQRGIHYLWGARNGRKVPDTQDNAYSRIWTKVGVVAVSRIRMFSRRGSAFARIAEDYDPAQKDE
jgi:hypothetical protein